MCVSRIQQDEFRDLPKQSRTDLNSLSFCLLRSRECSSSGSEAKLQEDRHRVHQILMDAVNARTHVEFHDFNGLNAMRKELLYLHAERSFLQKKYEEVDAMQARCAG